MFKTVLIFGFIFISYSIGIGNSQLRDSIEMSGFVEQQFPLGSDGTQAYLNEEIKQEINLISSKFQDFFNGFSLNYYPLMISILPFLIVMTVIFPMIIYYLTKMLSEYLLKDKFQIKKNLGEIKQCSMNNQEEEEVNLIRIHI